ncbi:hypothetical protein KGF54_001350 [Candida jiufengensis]|uniref:uncharacterized protein n=1 Tax=Candida jiufengensis TaxID=497108 RepID=UPI002224C10D|nr:uncharacterized protein KGF54_001350 [Candida jiufengensis]KAI5955848.1 hypothetical protein KGF54_001350 [Candida jiufengensis]
MATLRDSTTSLHNKRKINELEDISNTTSNNKQHSPYHYNNLKNLNSSSNLQQQLNKRSKLNNTTTTTTTTTTTSNAITPLSSSSIIEKPITRSNSKLLLQQQELQKQQSLHKSSSSLTSSISSRTHKRRNSSHNSINTSTDYYELDYKHNKNNISNTKQSNYTHKSSNSSNYKQITPPSPTPSDGLSNDELMNENSSQQLQQQEQSQEQEQVLFDNLEYQNGHIDSKDHHPIRPQHRRCKSVSFVLPNEDSKSFQHSPLLTPKDEEDEEEIDNYLKHQQKQNQTQQQQNATVYPSTPPESLSDHQSQDYMDPNFQNIITLQTKSKHELENEEEEELQSSKQNSILQNNSDFIVLNSSLNLSNYQNSKLKNDIIKLSNLKNKINEENHQNLKKFILDLYTGNLDLPKPESIIKSPFINWSKYHSSLININFQELVSNKNKLRDESTGEDLKYLNDDEIKLRIFDYIK